MTRLTYINRKSEGIKLGQIVAKDLRKRIKQSTPPKGDSHKEPALDILLDGKKLTDEGLSEMARGLEEALDAPVDAHQTKLRVLNLRGNELTVHSLAELAPSIRSASSDLEEIDLSGNLICVKTDEDLRDWQTFLESFRRVKHLTSLNLSGNDLSGIRPWEVFARVYGRHFYENESALELLTDGLDDPNFVDFNLPERLNSMNIHSGDCSDESLGTDSPGGHLSMQLQGLPSISTIMIARTALTDFGSLFLSYPLAQHTWLHDRVPVNYDHSASGNPAKGGIIYTENETLTALGVRLLRLAETVAYDPLPALPPVPENSPMSPKHTVDAGNERVRRISLALHHRKSSNGSSGDGVPKASIGHTSTEELDSLRKKMQRTILEERGQHNVQIWSAALRLLSYARQVMGEDATREPLRPHFPRSQAGSPINTEQLSMKPPNWLPYRKADSNGIVPAGTPPATIPQRSYFASKWVPDTGIGHTELPIAVPAAVHPPVTPKFSHSPHNRRDSFSYHSNSSSPGTKAAGEARASVVQAAMHMNDAEPRLIGPLPTRAWTVILSHLADPHGVLSDRQVQSVVNWARDKTTLIFEAEALGKPESVQIWRTLERVGCLEYDSRN